MTWRRGVLGAVCRGLPFGTSDPCCIIQGKKKHVNINKFAGLSRDWVGAKNLFMCFFGSFLMGEKKHINKIPPKSRDNPVKFCLRVFFFMCFFFSPPNYAHLSSHSKQPFTGVSMSSGLESQKKPPKKSSQALLTWAKTRVLKSDTSVSKRAY